MAEDYVLTHKAYAAVKAEKEKVLAWRKLKLITSKQARDMFNSFLARVIHQSTETTNS